MLGNNYLGRCSDAGNLICGTKVPQESNWSWVTVMKYGSNRIFRSEPRSHFNPGVPYLEEVGRLYISSLRGHDILR